MDLRNPPQAVPPLGRRMEDTRMKLEEILKMVDHTLLAQGSTWDEIKEICDHTTDMLENDGIWKALKRYDII